MDVLHCFLVYGTALIALFHFLQAGCYIGQIRRFTLQPADKFDESKKCPSVLNQITFNQPCRIAQITFKANGVQR